ncbi:hypothetical protein JCM21714_345 [Gracilibacillus boraciitolerans JCM 21714]|uniref:Cell wall elongation regulator TseB-like domain-containing protein n=1 Tax=Gracilibacillus boraciitolerans JCM 21714 TaxID=1298598 RepID=W4VDV2_9BACI|nr:DUF5590 domain-containing protein [Gracilibacillus boraciitolerans]GAE91397.1 hypothetical protein JCM21714_345 [Gracilibacillus boraciitolerans JCM 21714]
MKKLFLPFTEPNKIFLIIGLSFLVLIGFGYYFFSIYQDVMTSKRAGFADVEEFTRANSNLSVIHSIERYHGDQLYYVIDGETKENKAYYAFVYQTEGNFDLKLFEQESLYQEDILRSEWQSRCNSCEYLGSSIGLDNGVPVLEIKYLDDSDRLVYEHILLEDKSHYRLTLTPTFQ